jgi:hypothetical protein
MLCVFHIILGWVQKGGCGREIVYLIEKKAVQKNFGKDIQQWSVNINCVSLADTLKNK